MAANEQREETDEEFLARLIANKAKRKAAAEAAAEAAKPKLVVSVMPKIAEAVKANPASLRLSAKAVDDTVVVDRPRRTEIIEPLDEPTRDGCLTRARRFDCATGVWGIIEYNHGYRAQPGAKHEYDPLTGLRRSDDD